MLSDDAATNQMRLHQSVRSNSAKPPCNMDTISACDHMPPRAISAPMGAPSRVTMLSRMERAYNTGSWPGYGASVGHMLRCACQPMPPPPSGLPVTPNRGARAMPKYKPLGVSCGGASFVFNADSGQQEPRLGRKLCSASVGYDTHTHTHANLCGLRQCHAPKDNHNDGLIRSVETKGDRSQGATLEWRHLLSRLSVSTPWLPEVCNGSRFFAAAPPPVPQKAGPNRCLCWRGSNHPPTHFLQPGVRKLFFSHIAERKAR